MSDNNIIYGDEMIYRGCAIRADYFGYSWAAPDYQGPDDDGNSTDFGLCGSILSCKYQINQFLDN